jgi:hypothetical protein
MAIPSYETPRSAKYEAIRAFFRFLSTKAYSLEFSGEGNLPPEGPAVLAVYPHRWPGWEPGLLIGAVDELYSDRRRTIMISKPDAIPRVLFEVFEGPRLVAYRRKDEIPERPGYVMDVEEPPFGPRLRAELNKERLFPGAVDWLGKGGIVIGVPTGTRSDEPLDELEIHAGLSLMAKEGDAPIVPAIVYSSSSIPLNRPRLYVRIGEPVKVSDVGESRDYLRRSFSELSEGLFP